jgi:hypothetical protein
MLLLKLYQQSGKTLVLRIVLQLTPWHVEILLRTGSDGQVGLASRSPL